MTTVPSQTGNLSLDFSADGEGTYCIQTSYSLGTRRQRGCSISPSYRDDGRKPAVIIGHIPPNESLLVTYQPQSRRFPPKTIRILHSKDESHLGDAGTLRKIVVEFFENRLAGCDDNGEIVEFAPKCRVFQKSVVQHREHSPGLRVYGEPQPVSNGLICSHGSAELTATTTQVETYSLGCFHPESTVLGAFAAQDDGGESLLRDFNFSLRLGNHTLRPGREPHPPGVPGRNLYQYT